jgi:hypothetical protein
MLLKSCFTSLAPSRRTVHVDVDDLPLAGRGTGLAVVVFVGHVVDPALSGTTRCSLRNSSRGAVMGVTPSTIALSLGPL